MMKLLLARLYCFVTHHRRGKRTNVYRDNVSALVEYQCSRCGKRWSRLVKAKA